MKFLGDAFMRFMPARFQTLVSVLAVIATCNAQIAEYVDTREVKLSVFQVGTAVMAEITLQSVPSMTITIQNGSIVPNRSTLGRVHYNSKLNMRLRCVSDPPQGYAGIAYQFTGKRLIEECDKILDKFSDEIRALAPNVYPTREVDTLIDKKVNEKVATEQFRAELIKAFAPQLAKQIALLISKERQDSEDQNDAQQAKERRQSEDVNRPASAPTKEQAK